MSSHFIFKFSSEYNFQYRVHFHIDFNTNFSICGFSLVELLAEIELASIFIVMVINVIYFAVAMFQFALVKPCGCTDFCSIITFSMFTFLTNLGRVVLYFANGLYHFMHFFGHFFPICLLLFGYMDVG